MSTIAIQSFAGETPTVTPRLLEQQQAVEAVNCDVQRGSLEPLKCPAKVDDLDQPSISIFKHDRDGWLGWDRDVRPVKSAVLDVLGDKPLGHVFMTGERDYPTQYLAGGKVYRLGIPRPSTAPIVTVKQNAALGTVTVRGFGASSAAQIPSRYGTTGLPDIQPNGGMLVAFATSSIDGLPIDDDSDDISRSSSYCYTLVQSLADGVIQQESAPSPPSDVFDIKTGDGATITGFDIPKLEGLHITHIRLYRTVSGNKTSDFRLVCELPVETTTYTDTAHDKDISAEVLRTSQWDAIPDEAQGLIKTDNGLYACFRGNELLISEPFIAYAYPSSYRVTVEDSIVALGHVDGTIVVLTTGRPYLAQGGVPESLQIVHLPIEQACVSARSVGSLPGGVVYASPDGLMLFTASEQTLITGSIFTREQWQALHPDMLMGAVLDGRYIGFFAGTGKGFILNMGRKDVVWVNLPEGWKVHALYHHSEDDCVYLSIETPNDCGVYQFEAGEPLPFRWRSKPFFTSALVSMSALRVEGEQRPGDAIAVRVFGPDAARPRAILRLTDSKTKRLPTTRSEKLWSVEVAGVCPVYELRIGGSVEDLEYGR